MKKIFILTLLTSIALSASAQAQVSPQLKAQETTLVNCQKYEFKGPHPLVPNTVRHVQVQGMVDGKCLYTESMPNNGLLSCSLTDDQRKTLAAKGWMAAFDDFSNDPNTCKISGY